MPAWAAPGNNTHSHALLMPTWGHDGPDCMDSHGTAWSPPQGHGLVRIQVCMAAHGPMTTLVGRWFHGRTGPCTHGIAREFMSSPCGFHEGMI